MIKKLFILTFEFSKEIAPVDKMIINKKIKIVLIYILIMSNFNKVKIFMKIFGQKVETKPSFPEQKIQDLRYELIREELEELKVALEEKNLKRSC